MEYFAGIDVGSLSTEVVILDKTAGMIGYSIVETGASSTKAAEEAMEKAEIHDLQNHHFGTLSGGQKQRVLMARALVGNPELLLLDEPTASIDGRVEQDIYELLKKLNEKVTIILVSHDLGFISSYVKHVACVNRRLVCNPTNEITGDVIEACYSGPVHMIKHKCEL